MTPEKCIECGKLLVPNKYSALYCPRCNPYYNEQFDAMVKDTDGGYY